MAMTLIRFLSLNGDMRASYILRVGHPARSFCFFSALLLARIMSCSGVAYDRCQLKGVTHIHPDFVGNPTLFYSFNTMYRNASTVPAQYGHVMIAYCEWPWAHTHPSLPHVECKIRSRAREKEITSHKRDRAPCTGGEISCITPASEVATCPSVSGILYGNAYR